MHFHPFCRVAVNDAVSVYESPRPRRTALRATIGSTNPELPERINKGQNTMQTTHSITFPDGTVSTSETSTWRGQQMEIDEWALVASPMTAAEIRAQDEARIREAEREISQLEAALAAMSTTHEPFTVPIELGALPPLRKVGLDGTSITVLVNAAQIIMELNEDALGSDELLPFYVATEMTMIQGLTADVKAQVASRQERIQSVRSADAGDADSPDVRLSWRVLHWTSSEARAEKIRSKMRDASHVKVVRADQVSVAAPN
jgi:hypothetical protein